MDQINLSGRYNAEHLVKSPVCILGMHRSGTSSLAGSLEERGLYLGEVVNASPHNKKGNKESKLLRTINDEVLAFNNGAWDDPPNQLNWTETHRRQRDALIAQFSGCGIWGFKDPRTVLTLPFWLEACPGTKIVATFRHPSLVVASMERRKALAPQMPPLDLWKAYNRRLIDVLDRSQCPVICFDWSAPRYAKAIDALASDLRLNPPSSATGRFFEEQLRTANPGPVETVPNDDYAMVLYQRLLDHSGRFYGANA